MGVDDQDSGPRGPYPLDLEKRGWCWYETVTVDGPKLDCRQHRDSVLLHPTTARNGAVGGLASGIAQAATAGYHMHACAEFGSTETRAPGSAKLRSRHTEGSGRVNPDCTKWCSRGSREDSADGQPSAKLLIPLRFSPVPAMIEGIP